MGPYISYGFPMDFIYFPTELYIYIYHVYIYIYTPLRERVKFSNSMLAGACLQGVPEHGAVSLNRGRGGGHHSHRREQIANPRMPMAMAMAMAHGHGYAADHDPPHRTYRP